MQSGYQTELHLFGRDEDNQIPLMNTLISELKLSDKVKIFKYTNQPLQKFKNSKASLLTSQYEGFGLTLMESIEMGCQSYLITFVTVQVKLFKTDKWLSH